MTIKELVKKRWILRSIIKTVYFNFHYLPFRQAIKFPILVYKLKIVRMRGEILISSNIIKPGMIKLGVHRVSIYPNSGIVWENHGGIVIFEGSCNIGGNSALSIGPKGVVTFGDNFSATTSFKLICYNNIGFGESVEFGWDCICMDTDFHRMKLIDGEFTKGFGSIRIGNGNWIANRCTVLKNTLTSEYCTFSSSSVINGRYDKPYTLYGSSAITLKKTGIYRDRKNDAVIYQSTNNL